MRFHFSHSTLLIRLFGGGNPLRTVVRTGLVSLAAVSLGLAAHAQEVNWNTLNLSPQQANQIHQLESSWAKTHDEISTQLEQDQNELRQILPSGDIQRIRHLQNRISTNKMYLMNQSMETFLKKRNTLNPNQRQQLQRMLPAQIRQTIE